MRIKPLYNINVQENDLSASVERLKDSVYKTVSSIVQSQIIAGDLLANIDLDTTAKRIEHKLGRKPLGYIVVSQDANAVVYRQPEDREDMFLNLAASAAVNVSLWIF